jgi:hypothetical protein
MKTAKPKDRKSDLHSRLNSYVESVRRPQEGTREHRPSNWTAYATVAGSALAMASSASAAIIYTNGSPVTSSISSISKSVFAQRYDQPGFPLAGRDLELALVQSHRSATPTLLSGFAEIFSSKFANLFGDAKSALVLKRLNSGDAISSLAASWMRVGVLFDGNTSVGHEGVFNSGQAGLAALRLPTAGGQFDYGWIRLEYSNGANGLPDSFEAIDWAYNNTPGMAIEAGQQVAGAPEPSTAAMALLAAGAAGVLALRRRKLPVSE